jgi:hypothetical protein
MLDLLREIIAREVPGAERLIGGKNRENNIFF